MPFDVAKVWGSRGQLKVTGDINGFALRTSLFPTGHGRHIMIVNRTMQAGGRVRLGMEARFRIEPDIEERVVEPPKEWLEVLSESKRLRKFYDSLSHSRRKEIACWVGLGRQAQTRSGRAQQIAERLWETMDAERQLPPLIERSLAQNPIAREGWRLMPPGCRRSHLLGIFHYRNPDSRARRLAKAVADMVEYGERSAARKSKSQ